MNSILNAIASIHYGKSPSEVIDTYGMYPIIGTGGEYGKASEALFSVGIVVPRKGSLGKPHLLEKPFWSADTTYAVIPNNQIDVRWLYYNLLHFDLTRLNEATGVPSISRDWLAKLAFFDPGYEAQKKIAEILSTIDRTIAKTEALIEKYQQIKAGLMHDLFTRGIGADGKLRSPCEVAPELYKNSAIGWIPKEWNLTVLNSVIESLIDGPFGSNLKTEHYVSDPGVRVVRLQNIQSTKYNDQDRAFVSDRHANFLLKNKVVGNDVLVAGLGEERYPVGRSCLYPEALPPALNKADCFRLRCLSQEMLNNFAMYFLNASLAKAQVRKFVQGVTRPRINTGNMKKLIIVQPTLDEQFLICERLDKLASKIKILIEEKTKLQKQKSGLMHDLLTGKVSVNIDSDAS